MRRCSGPWQNGHSPPLGDRRRAGAALQAQLLEGHASEIAAVTASREQHIEMSRQERAPLAFSSALNRLPRLHKVTERGEPE
ncbi:hypothetical protein NDU88_003109 [Pleurodeles waltl]|uniref:Uncharacterized protein n=1 Tax=Pleurodeles waltl TaxID=8319 RepID=A0AAV7UBH3_PLEWA|nr:hypothetical protein NDU88_003109 [Pleurodeles waltl]